MSSLSLSLSSSMSTGRPFTLTVLLASAIWWMIIIIITIIINNNKNNDNNNNKPLVLNYRAIKQKPDPTLGRKKRRQLIKYHPLSGVTVILQQLQDISCCWRDVFLKRRNISYRRRLPTVKIVRSRRCNGLHFILKKQKELFCLALCRGPAYNFYLVNLLFNVTLVFILRNFTLLMWVLVCAQ